MSGKTLGKAFEDWALDRPELKAVLLLGSRARNANLAGTWDEGSDWDFQVVTSSLELFVDGRWAVFAQLPKPLAHVTRTGRVARITKLSGVFPNGDIDIVLLPALHLNLARFLMSVGLANRVPGVRNALAELATVLLPGYRLIKGCSRWNNFFASVVAKIPSVRLTDQMICELAEAYVIDYVSTRKKINRGEYIAGQRWLHTQLSETNFRLLHELKLRLREPTFPDGRRLEQFAGDHWLSAVSVNALLNHESILSALEKNAETLRGLVRELVGSKWKWPLRNE